MKAFIELLGSLSLLVATWVFLPNLKSTLPILPNIASPQTSAAPVAPLQWIPISELRSLQ